MLMFHSKLWRVLTSKILYKGVIAMSTQPRNIDIEERHVEKKSDSSLVASTFIKYAAYIIIIFGVLYFLVHYVFPMF